MRRLVLLAALPLGACARDSAGLDAVREYWTADEPDTPDPHPLDDIDRDVPRSGPLTCPDVALVDYRGELVRYRGALKVHPSFRDRLKRFEAIVAEVGREVYGRPPVRIRHFGSHLCRRIEGSARLSEHALGNALDVAGFEFGRAPKGQAPPSLGGAFTVSVVKHWTPGARPEAQRHARFLHRLRERLVDEAVFRHLLAPPSPGHHDHLHVDAGPRRWRSWWFGDG